MSEAAATGASPAAAGSATGSPPASGSPSATGSPSAGGSPPTGTLQIYGTLDPHVHLRGMEWSHKGTFASETAAALAGGYCAVFDMPNTPPATVDEASLQRKFTDMAEQSRCDYRVWLGANPKEEPNPQELTQLGPQVCGLKLYCGETTGGLLIDRPLMDSYVAAWNGPGPLGLHAEGDMIQHFIESLQRHGKVGHICHIPTKEAVDYLRDARQAGTQVTAGVSPHHLFFTDRDLQTLGPKAVMKPPLGRSADRDALWEGLRSGLIDMVETDHAPHTWEEKDQHQPAFGVSGLDTCLPLMLTAASEGRIGYDQLPRILAEAPREVFGLPAPDQNSYTILDTQARWTLTTEHLHTDCGWSPYEGMQLVGRVQEVVLRGKTVFEDGQVLAEPGYGQKL